MPEQTSITKFQSWDRTEACRKDRRLRLLASSRVPRSRVEYFSESCVAGRHLGSSSLHRSSRPEWLLGGVRMSAILSAQPELPSSSNLPTLTPVTAIRTAKLENAGEPVKVALPTNPKLIIRSMVWLVTPLFGCVCGLTCCHRGRSEAMPHRSMGFSTSLPPKSRLKWLPTLPRADFQSNS